MGKSLLKEPNEPERMSRFKAAGVDGVWKGQSHPLRRSEMKRPNFPPSHLITFFLSHWLILKAKRKRMRRKNLDVIQESVGCLVFCNFHNLKLLGGGVMICNRRRAAKSERSAGRGGEKLSALTFSAAIFTPATDTNIFTEIFAFVILYFCVLFAYRRQQNSGKEM